MITAGTCGLLSIVRVARAGGTDSEAAIAAVQITVTLEKPVTLVEAVKETLVAPPVIVTKSGTDTAGLVHVMLSLTPGGGAGEEIVTVPVADCPGVTNPGLNVKPVSAGGSKMS